MRRRDFANSINNRLMMPLSTTHRTSLTSTGIIPTSFRPQILLSDRNLASTEAKKSAYIHLLTVCYINFGTINILTCPTGRPCDCNGNFIPNGTPPLPWDDRAPEDFSPFQNREAYQLADLLYRRNQMPEHQIDDLLQIWAQTLPLEEDELLFTSVRDLYATLDSIDLANIRWQSFSLSYKPKDGATGVDATWKSNEYDVWYRDPHEVLKAQLSNRDFANEMDFAPKVVVDKDKRTRRYQDFMSGEWAWEQAARIR
jgi:hypothetical protein